MPDSIGAAVPGVGPRPRPALTRAVVLLDLLMGLVAVAIVAGYVYLRFENFRMVIGGTKIHFFGFFHSLVGAEALAASLAGLGDFPFGPNSRAFGVSSLAPFGAFKIMHFFVGMAIGHAAMAAGWFALADGLSRGLGWARWAHVVLGWIGLALVAGYAGLYLLTPDAPWAGLLVVVGSATVPSAMILAGRAAPGGDATSTRRRLGWPAWSLIAAGLLVVATAIHLVLAWVSILVARAVYL